MIEEFPFGRTSDRRKVFRYRLCGAEGAYVDILNYGGVIQSLVVPDRRGRPVDVALGFESTRDYEADESRLGALIGRWAGLISGASFELGGVQRSLTANDGPHHFNGGRQGFHRRLWTASTDDSGGLVLKRLAPDGEEGYPGALSVRVRYSFDERNRLTLEYEAESDRNTIVNLTSRPYFNLSGAGSGDILNHLLFIEADYIAETDLEMIPTGRLLPVQGTPFAFNVSRPIGDRRAAAAPELESEGGYNHYWALSRAPKGRRASVALVKPGPGRQEPTASRSHLKSPERPAARVLSPVTGIEMEMFTTEPGLRFYTGHHLRNCRGKAGADYGPRSGFCLEAQFWPDAVNQPAFPKAVLKKGDLYRQITRYEFRSSSL